MAVKSRKKVWKEYRFADGFCCWVRGLSAREKGSYERIHGKCIAIIDSDVAY